MTRLLTSIGSTDHKVIAKWFLWSGMVFLALGGLLAMVMRWQWAYPHRAVPVVGELLFADSGGAVSPASYTGLFTSHGLIMIFFAVTPILIGAFGNFLIPLQIGARDMAFPNLNRLSLWLSLGAQVLALASIVAPEAPSAGWTMYAPLSSGPSNAGVGQTLMIGAIFVVGLSSVVGAINYITTILMMRAKGMHLFRLPLTIWGFFFTAILNALFVPVLSTAALLLFCDRVWSTSFFTPAVGDPVLYQHLFWLFGHPEVYILILPVWGIVGDILAVFSGKAPNWYRGTVYSMAAVTLLSGTVYGHHLYQTGMGPMLGGAFEALTLAISAPSAVLFANFMLTMRRGQLRLTLPMVFALSTLVVFAFGGITGLYLGPISLDIYLHDSLWVVGHFHLIMAAATLMGSFAAFTFWFPKLFGRKLHHGIGVVHAFGTLIFALMTFAGLLWAGYEGQGRRLFDPFQYEFLVHLKAVNRHTSYAAFILGAFQLLFVGNVFWSLVRGPKAEENPGGASTLEWQTGSPPPVQNFQAEPVVRHDPHVPSSRGSRTFIAQNAAREECHD